MLNQLKNNYAKYLDSFIWINSHNLNNWMCWRNIINDNKTHSRNLYITVTPTPQIVYKTVTTSNQQSKSEWIWSRDNWGDWQHAVSWTEKKPATNSEYGPVVIGDHGEYGTNTQIYGGSSKSSVWRTFNNPSGLGWNTIEFTVMLTATDTPLGRG